MNLVSLDFQYGVWYIFEHRERYIKEGVNGCHD